MDPKLVMPLTDRVEPRRSMDLSDSDDPRCALSNTDNWLPSRPKLRSDMEAPKCEISKTDKVDPTRIMPNNAKDDPIRTKLLKASEDPSVS